SGRRRHTRSDRDWISVVCSSDLAGARSTVTLSPCLSGQPPAPGVSLVGPGSPHVFAPAGLSRGTLVTFCFAGTFDPAPEQFRLKIGRASCRGRSYRTL